jgi:hypothetical protein
MFTTFYHGTIRKYVVAFGTLFNDIYINRTNSSGDTIQTMKVPLSYGPKEKFLSRIDNDPDFDRPAIVLPRMAFEIININYDPDRKLNTLNRNVTQNPQNANQVFSQYQSVPYNLGVSLDIMAKNTDDATRIVEQIIPYFTPTWNVTMQLVPDIGLNVDVPIVLNTVSSQDTYEGDYVSRRAIVFSLGFTMKCQFFGPIKKSALIKTTKLNYYVPDGITIDQAIANSAIAEKTTLTPGLTSGGEPTSNAANSVDISEIDADDNYGFITDFDSIEDAPYEQ